MEGGFFAWAGLARLAALAGVGAAGFFGWASWLVELLAKLPHLLRRQALDAAQEVVEIAVRHRSIRVIISLSFFYLDYHGWGLLPSS